MACFQVFFILFAFGTFHWETKDTARFQAAGKTRRAAINVLVVLLLLGTIAAEAYLPDWAPAYRSLIIRAVYAVKAGLLVWFIQARMGAYEPPSLGSARMALFLILFGFSLPVLFPTFVVGVSHFTYIAGFCWFVLARASTLVEVRRLPVARWRTVILYGSFLLTGGLLRAVADFSPGGRELLLPLAAGFVLLPIFLWAFLFFPLIGDSRTRDVSRA